MRKINLRIKLKKIIPNIIVLIASLFISLIFLEMILRFIVPLPLACALLDKDETLVYRNKANIDYLDKNPEYRVRYSTNSNGIRDNEVLKFDKNEGEIRIFTIGDSFTYGLGLNLEDTFQFKLENKLKNKLNKDVNVINGGVGGYGSKQSLEFLRKKIGDYKPDIVLFSFYNNDVTDDMKYDKFTFENNCVIAKDIGKARKFLFFNSRAYLLYESYKNYLTQGIRPVRNILYLIRNLLNIEAKIGTPILEKQYSDELKVGWNNTLSNIKEMKSLCQKNYCDFILVYIPDRIQVNINFRKDYLIRNNLNEGNFDFQKPGIILGNFSKKNKIIYINLMEEFDKLKIDNNNLQLYYQFDPHFNKNGAEVWSKIVFEKVIEIS